MLSTHHQQDGSTRATENIQTLLTLAGRGVRLVVTVIVLAVLASIAITHCGIVLNVPGVTP